jgi:HAD superfamily hydrolase (TIGR01458 family)
MRIRGVLIDLSGTLHIEDSVIPGSIEALARLASIPGIKVKFVTNTTKESRKKLVTRLHRLGFHEIAESQLLTSLSATRTLITEQLKLKHPMLFLDPNAEEEFSDLKVNGAQTEFDSVVIGLAPDKFEYSRLNAAFRLIREKNVPLIATHKARYYREKGGVSLGPGAFVIGLEYATGVTAHVVGKPDPAFFLQVLQEMY